MARPVKWRKIEALPIVSSFVPQADPSAGAEASSRGENILKLEELEALRLKDLEGMEQEECAQQMEVSRPTFQRILIAAREKVADSLIHGKSIRIEGGHFTQNLCIVHCASCGRVWKAPFEVIGENPADGIPCPDCGASAPSCNPAGGRGSCPRGRCRYRRRIDEQHRED